MHDLIERIFEYVAAVIQYRWYALMVTAIVCLCGWTAVVLLPDRYESEGRIYIDTKSILQPLLRGLAVDRDVNQEIAALQQLLVTRPSLEEVARRTGLDAGIEDVHQQEGMLAGLRNSIEVGASGQGIFLIDVTRDDPRMAALIAQALIDVFVESSAGLGRSDLDTATRFLDEQIADYESRLHDAEQRAADFKQANFAYLSQPGGFQSGLDSAQRAMRALEASVREVQTELAILKGEMAATPQTIEPTRLQTTSPVAELELKLAQMLTRFTPQHPDVVALRHSIETLKRNGAAGSAAAGGTATVVPNPSYSVIRVKVVDKETELAKLQEQLRSSREEVRTLQSRAYAAPEIEAEMTRLNRDYGVLKSRYEEMLARREEAKLSRNREESGDRVQFRIVDPPRIPIGPQGPPRVILLTAVPVLGVGAGLVFAVLLSMLHGAFMSSKQLTRELGVPVIGQITYVPDDRTVRNRRVNAVAFAALSSGLVAMFLLLIAVESQVGLRKVVETAMSSRSIQPSVELVSRGLGRIFAP